MALTKEIFTKTIANSVMRQNGAMFYDGKNLWVSTLQASTGLDRIYIYNFWGPPVYQTSYIDDYMQWAEPAVDEVTFPSFAENKIKLVGVITIPVGTVVQMLKQSPGIVTVVLSNDEWRHYNENTFMLISTETKVKPAVTAPTVWTGPFVDENGNAYTPSSKWVITSSVNRNYIETPHFYYVVNDTPTAQTGNDTQYLYRYNLTTGVYVGKTEIPGRKQDLSRYIAFNDGRVYVSAYNQRGCYVFDSATGAFVRHIEVNRDAAEMFTYGDKVYISSRLNLFSSIDKLFYVTDIGAIDTRNATIALISTIPDYQWYNIDKLAVGKFDAGATTWSASGNFVEYFKKDGTSGKRFDLSTAVVAVAFVPEQKYDYYILDTFSPVDIPAYLFFITNQSGNVSTINAVRFPNLYAGSAIKNYGGVAAVSTGKQRFKGDDC